MSGIKLKKGHCIDCPQDATDTYLVAKRCQSHYRSHRAKVCADRPKNKAKTEVKKVTGVYMANQTLQVPELCEESGQRLPTSPGWLRRSCVAHILPKRGDFGFPSVATHPQNKVFLYPDIHHDMDNFGEEYIKKMKCLPVLKKRVKVLLPLLTPEELNRVPEYLI